MRKVQMAPSFTPWKTALPTSAKTLNSPHSSKKPSTSSFKNRTPFSTCKLSNKIPNSSTTFSDSAPPFSNQIKPSFTQVPSNC